MRPTRNVIRETQTYRPKTDWFDWAMSRILWPWLLVSIGGAIFYAWVRLCEVTLWRW